MDERAPIDVRSFTVGVFQENCYLARAERSARAAILIDPGDEHERIQHAIEELGVDVEAILITHCHVDHIGAVAPLARATGAPVYCPEIELPMLADIMSFVPFAGVGPFESYAADHALQGGERLSLAGLEIDVLSTPGHSPGHVSYSIPSHAAVFSGDVLFQGSIGRTDLPGADHATLMASIARMLEELDPQTTVFPGHIGITTLARERATNPFLAELQPAT